MVKDESVVDIVHEDVIDNKQGTTIKGSFGGGSDELLGRGVHCTVIKRVSSTRRGNINRAFIHNKQSA